MENENIPVTLQEIYLNVLESDSSVSRRALKSMVYDKRRDFLLIGERIRIAVKIDYTNDRYHETQEVRGVRRPVTIALVDATSSSKIASTSAIAFVPPRQYTWSNVALIEIDPSKKIDFTHEFMVEVYDDKTGVVLGQKEMRIFHFTESGDDIIEAFDAVSAGVLPEFSTVPHIAFKAGKGSCNELYFNIQAEDWTNKLAFIPEMEMRIYNPDGNIYQQFVDPTANDVGENRYRVATSFLVTSLRRGIVYAEILCLDIAIAGIVFDTGAKKDEQREWKNRNLYILPEYSYEEAACRFDKAITELKDDEFEELLNNFISAQMSENQSEDPAPKTEVEDSPAPTPYVSPLKALDSLTGLKSVKEKLTAYEKLVLFNKERSERNLPVIKLPLHAMFWGSPGTGKTTVAKRMGLMLRRAGVLSKGHIVVRERATLLGPNYSNEESNTQAAIEEAQGGILFIDEAYQLYQPKDPRDPGRFVIEALMTALADESKRDWMLILAGYTEEMKQMFEMNPGLKSRIPESNIYIFEDFTEPELMEIAERYLVRHSYSMSAQAKASLELRLHDDYQHRDKTFGNARYVINLIQTEILPSMAQRVVSTGQFDESTLCEIQSNDIPHPLNICQHQRPKIGYRV